MTASDPLLLVVYNPVPSFVRVFVCVRSRTTESVSSKPGRHTTLAAAFRVPTGEGFYRPSDVTYYWRLKFIRFSRGTMREGEHHQNVSWKRMDRMKKRHVKRAWYLRIEIEINYGQKKEFKENLVCCSFNKFYFSSQILVWGIDVNFLLNKQFIVTFYIF